MFLTFISKHKHNTRTSEVISEKSHSFSRKFSEVTELKSEFLQIVSLIHKYLNKILLLFLLLLCIILRNRLHSSKHLLIHSIVSKSILSVCFH